MTEKKSETPEIEETSAVEPDTTEVDETAESAEADETAADVPAEKAEKRGIRWSRVLAYGILPGLALILAMASGFLKWQDNSVRNGDIAAIESVQAAKDGTVALLSYQPDTVEQQLSSARELLTGEFRDSYTSLTTDVVIPGAKEKQIAAVATVPAAASVSADPNHAVVLVFVNQTVTVGDSVPSDTASSVRVTMENIDDRWVISGFDPV